MVAVGLSAASLGGLNLELVRKGVQQMHVLCIGLGGGGLSLFLTHNFPGAIVDTVEIDNTVIAAATKAMGFPASCVISHKGKSKSPNEGEDQRASYVQSLQKSDTTRGQDIEVIEIAEVLSDVAGRLQVHEADGEFFLWKACQTSGLISRSYDLVFVDAYDGNDEIPSQLTEKNGIFVHALSRLLNPTHGTVVVNLHTDSPPPSLLENITGAFGPGFDPSLPQGSVIQSTGLTYRDVLLGDMNVSAQRTYTQFASASHRVVPYEVLRGGIAFTVAAPRHQNICLTVSRSCTQSAWTREARHTVPGEDAIQKLLLKELLDEAQKVENLLGICIGLPQRVCRGFHLLH